MKKYIFILFLFFSFFKLSAQTFYTLSGMVTDKETSSPLEHVSVSIHGTNVGSLTDVDGRYSFCDMQPGKYELLITFVGYKPESIIIDLTSNVELDIQLESLVIALSEFVIDAMEPRISSGYPVLFSRHDRVDKLSVNLSQSLLNIPGISIINIGSGVAKPVIRGLAFNRVAVINKGITQQNQQWGADHGMEVNQFDMDYATVHKGANSLLFGSDAMAAIEIIPHGFKKNEDFFAGEATLFATTNNNQLGGAITTEWQKRNWYIRGAYNYQDYADYKVPAKEFTYMGESYPIYNKRLKNTAGKEQSISGTLGYRKNNVHSYFNVSNNYQKMGFFAGAHGIPDADELLPDGSNRNIDMPFTCSNHFSVTNNTEWKTNAFRLVANIGYQNNHRQEFALPHSHEGHDHEEHEEHDHIESDNLEVDFKLQTYSANIRMYFDENKKWKKTIGISTEYQQNRIGGHEFFLPRFNQITGGLFFVNNYEISDKFSIEGGLRYDIGNIDITGFYDEELAEHLGEDGHGHSLEDIDEIARKAFDVNRNIGSFSGSFGAYFRVNNDLRLNMNIGKSFRFPSANELAANGEHHAAFRYEVGNPDLKAENGYSFDLGVDCSLSSFNLNVSPFINYYSNFIYLRQLNSSPGHGGESVQKYKYDQAKALFGGAEYAAVWEINSYLKLSSMGQYVINKNLDTHNPLPFTPPFSMKNELEYSKNVYHNALEFYRFAISHQLYADQNRVALGEEKTDGANLFNVSAGFHYRFNRKWLVRLNVEVQNVFDTRYFNHLSFYRKLNIPESGRNIQVFVRIPFL